MSTDPTELQRDSEREQARQRSLLRTHPPTQVPGYEAERLLGGGAYGEVWLAVERNTGRRVAIKFYAHRGGLDWSLLSREVEKLSFLFADRYVVQLLAVGWDAEPPYYVMEYVERGSLAERLQEGPVPVAEAVATVRDVAIGLVHAHAKGILHCDLKPANILLDQDGKPRLADFGQSRLSTEQTPALGTLFFMAPEQADLEAIPDARWDIYALGALLYCLLTGAPPHRTDEAAQTIDDAVNLTQRLSRYRKTIQQSPLPTGHRRAGGVDSELAAIVDRCLAPDPEDRFPTMQAVLDAFDARDRRRAQRPLLLLGTVGPALLLLVVSLFFWQGFTTALRQSDAALTDRAIESNHFAAQYVARTAAEELQRRWAAVNRVAYSAEVKQALADLYAAPDAVPLMTRLSDPDLPEDEAEPLRQQFRDHPARQALQAALAAAIPTYVDAPDDV
ncbi:MAG: serine/threonine-protein kinase, partial [Patescibacteria group bacterium]|nr:serine/threonine-protein kinase [Patescibacteria group bacterium]